jgi:hypothetical protein
MEAFKAGSAPGEGGFGPMDDMTQQVSGQPGMAPGQPAPNAPPPSAVDQGTGGLY